MMKGYLGYDPMEQKLQEQKLWAGLYGQAASPYEKMGLSLAQIGGALIGGDTGASQRETSLKKALGEAAQKYTEGTPEYYQAIADALPPEMIEARSFAQAKYREAVKETNKAYTDAITSIKTNPEGVSVFTDPLAADLLKKATAAGWNEGDRPIPTTKEEIRQFAKDYGLDKTKEYRQLIAFTDVAERSAAKLEKEAKLLDLNITDKQVSIDVGRQKLAEAGKDVYSAREFMRVNGLDPTKPLEEQLSPRQMAFGLQGFITVQKKALEGYKGVPTPPPAGGSGDWSATIKPPVKKP